MIKIVEDIEVVDHVKASLSISDDDPGKMLKVKT